MRDLFASTICALLVAGCGESHGATDGGPTGMDDSGIITRDSGTAPRDSGPGLDSGTPGSDSGTPGDDAGSPVDSGGIPTRMGAVGSACEGDADCTEPAGSMCQTRLGSGGFAYEFPGGYCTASCTPGSGSSECGAGADCYSFGFGDGFCAKTCTRDADCRTDDGYTCMAPPFGGGSTMYCLPPFGGGGGRDGGGFTLPDGGGFMRP